MKKYDVLIANPAGNITALVFNKEVDKEEYMIIANKLMDIHDLGIEQVGFVRNSKIDGVPRLEMMGGEFCGNATRSFGLYIANCRGAIDSESVLVEISGCSSVLEVETDVKTNYASTVMPLPVGFDYIQIDDYDCIPVIEFEGIVHVIAEDIEVSNEVYEKIKQVIINKYDFEAFGIMFLNRNRLKITPLVYVKETNSVVYENSCGSGSVATAIYLAKDKSDGVYVFDISNPGGIIKAKVYIKEGAINKATIGGQVTLSQIKSITFC